MDYGKNFYCSRANTINDKVVWVNNHFVGVGYASQSVYVWV